jgi:hypothetical protein
VRFVSPKYPLSELSREVIAGFYRSMDAIRLSGYDGIQAEEKPDHELRE